MINHQELRLGNYIRVHNMVQQVSALSMDNESNQGPVVGYRKDNRLYYENCRENHVGPVALTDALLEKCGFLFDDYFKLWQKQKTVPGAGVAMELDRDFSALDFMRKPLLKNINSLHQLQNFYFVTKGKELETDVSIFESAF